MGLCAAITESFIRAINVFVLTKYGVYLEHDSKFSLNEALKGSFHTEAGAPF